MLCWDDEGPHHVNPSFVVQSDFVAAPVQHLPAAVRQRPLLGLLLQSSHVCLGDAGAAGTQRWSELPAVTSGH